VEFVILSIFELVIHPIYCQGVSMLEKACHAVEQAGRGGGVYPEVVFEVAKQWEWIHKKVD